MRLIARVFAGPVMFLAGLNHFLNPSFYLAIMPEGLPAHRELNYIAGLLEMIGALAVTYPRTRRQGGWLLTATLIAVFPANIHMALHPERYERFPYWALLARLPLQALFIYWVRVAAKHDTDPTTADVPAEGARVG